MKKPRCRSTKRKWDGAVNHTELAKAERFELSVMVRILQCWLERECPFEEQFDIRVYGILSSKWAGEMADADLIVPTMGGKSCGGGREQMTLTQLAWRKSHGGLPPWGEVRWWVGMRLFPQRRCWGTHAYGLSLFSLVAVLPSHPDFSLPRGTVLWNHQWCPQWHQPMPAPLESDLPDLSEASIREISDLSEMLDTLAVSSILCEHFHKKYVLSRVFWC